VFLGAPQKPAPPPEQRRGRPGPCFRFVLRRVFVVLFTGFKHRVWFFHPKKEGKGGEKKTIVFLLRGHHDGLFAREKKLFFPRGAAPARRVEAG